MLVSGGDRFRQTATLRGLVTDESGALVQKASVTLTGSNGLALAAITDDRGTYVFPRLEPGDYVVSASAPELATAQALRMSLTAGTTTLNLQLKLIAAPQHITVQETAGPALSTEASNNASAVVLRADDLQALSDDPEDLMTDLQALAGPAAGPNGGAIFIDGFSGGELPSKEAIREVRVNQNPFSPEYDALGFGRVDVFTKPGADHFRGAIDYNFADEVWNSRNPYSAEKAPLVLNELEGNIGGPLGKRASFFFDFQRNTVDNGAIINAVTLNSQNAIQPFFGVYNVPQNFTRGSPRIDYQINDKNTLTLRYSITHSDINGTGIGSFDLDSRGYNFSYLNQTAQITETAVLGSTINETRFQYFRSAVDRLPFSDAPARATWDPLTPGARRLGYPRTRRTISSCRITRPFPRARMSGSSARGCENRATITSRGRISTGHTFSGVPETSVRSSLFSRRSRDCQAPSRRSTPSPRGSPEHLVRQFDASAFVGDDWRVRPNLTLSYGLRYEMQTNIHDWADFAPRLAVAWAPAGAPKTLIRKPSSAPGSECFMTAFLSPMCSWRGAITEPTSANTSSIIRISSQGRRYWPEPRMSPRGCIQPASALLSAKLRNGGAPITSAHHDGADLCQHAWLARTALGRHQRPGSGDLQPKRSRQRSLS